MTDFSSLYRRYAADVFRFALYLTGNRADAEDITSETFVRAWTSSEPIRVETLKGYLFTIARNLHLQRLRKTRRDVPLPEEMPDPQAGPLDRAQQKDTFRAVLARLQELPEADRSAVLLRAVEGLSYEEIARALHLSLSAVKTKIHRARLAFADIRKEKP
ncbi:MAG TPA: RNA polymerase sigma factor [Thermoanaerobaculia bacterium]|nr:RNA polymerase sigma factor [Thermoanaerobaculia bacterium]